MIICCCQNHGSYQRNCVIRKKNFQMAHKCCRTHVNQSKKFHDLDDRFNTLNKQNLEPAGFGVEYAWEAHLLRKSHNFPSRTIYNSDGARCKSLCIGCLLLKEYLNENRKSIQKIEIEWHIYLMLQKPVPALLVASSFYLPASSCWTVDQVFF